MTSSPFTRCGFALSTSREPDELVALGRRGDELGLHSMWLGESYHHRSAMPLATLIASATTQIKVGLGVLITPTRHPALMAMEGATVDELSAGRLVLGLGVGRSVAPRHGVDVPLLATLRDSLTIVKGMLRGEVVTYRGKAFTVTDTHLDLGARPDLPLYVGCYPFSPKALAIAGELADGVVYNWPTPEWVRRGNEAIAEGALRAGRDPASVQIASYFVFSVDDDERRARDACRRTVAQYTCIAHEPWRRAGIVDGDDVDPVIEAVARGGLDAGAKVVSDRLLDRVAIAGDPHTCRDRLREYVGTGLDLPIAYSVLGPDPFHALELIADVVIG